MDHCYVVILCFMRLKQIRHPFLFRNLTFLKHQNVSNVTLTLMTSSKKGDPPVGKEIFNTFSILILKFYVRLQLLRMLYPLRQR